MGRQIKPAPKVDRVQLSFQVDAPQMERIRAATIPSGRSISGECIHRITQTLLEGDAMDRRYGRDALMMSVIADGAETARHLAESLAASEGSDHDDPRIERAVMEAMRTAIAWHDPFSEQKITNPQHIDGGVLSWATVALHAVWAVGLRVTSDPRRLAAFKARDAKFRKKRSR